MFSGVDTGDKPSAIKSGKIKPKLKDSLIEKKLTSVKNIGILKGNFGILKKVVIFSFILLLLIILVVLGFEFNKNNKINNINKESNKPDNIIQPIIEKEIDEPVIDLSEVDDDSDGLSNAEEIELRTDPYNPDSDNDGLFDREEVKIWGTNPLDPDSDNDNDLDGIEIENGNNPLGEGRLPGLEDFNIEEESELENFDIEEEIDSSLLDNDNDGLSNLEEIEFGTDLNNPDTDGDGYYDGDEVDNGYNPLGEGEL